MVMLALWDSSVYIFGIYKAILTNLLQPPPPEKASKSFILSLIIFNNFLLIPNELSPYNIDLKTYTVSNK